MWFTSICPHYPSWTFSTRCQPILTHSTSLVSSLTAYENFTDESTLVSISYCVLFFLYITRLHASWRVSSLQRRMSQLGRTVSVEGACAPTGVIYDMMLIGSFLHNLMSSDADSFRLQTKALTVTIYYPPSAPIPFYANASLNTSPANAQQVQDAFFRALAQGLFSAFLDAIVPTLSPLGVGCTVAVAQVALPCLTDCITVALTPVFCF
jgi:hypothetical protein